MLFFELLSMYLIGFWHTVFSFALVSRILKKFSFLISSRTHFYSVVVFNLHKFVYALGFLFLLILLCCNQIEHKQLFQLHIFIKIFFCVLIICPVLENFHALLRKTSLDGLFCRCLLCPFNLWCHLIYKFLSLLFIWMICQLVGVGYWNYTLLLCYG